MSGARPIRISRLRPTGVRGRKVRLDGFVFDSQAEALRYGELRLLEKAGEILALEVHPSFPLTVKVDETTRAVLGRYEADFRYAVRHPAGVETVIEDVKGARRGRAGKKGWSTRTALYRWKKKHVEAEHGVEIREVER